MITLPPEQCISVLSAFLNRQAINPTEGAGLNYAVLSLQEHLKTLAELQAKIEPPKE